MVKSGRFANRSEVIREATKLLLSAGDTPPQASKARSTAHLVSLMIAWTTPDVKAIVLYGSLARAEFTPQSDIDILTIIGRGVPWRVRRTLYDIIYPVIVGMGVDVSLLVVERAGWLNMIQEGDPLARSIRKEGVLLWGSLEHPA